MSQASFFQTVIRLEPNQYVLFLLYIFKIASTKYSIYIKYQLDRLLEGNLFAEHHNTIQYGICSIHYSGMIYLFQ